MKVLIFEDEPLQRVEMERRLMNQGYEVKSFSSPSLAFTFIEEGNWFPDLVLLDIALDVISEDLKQKEDALGFPSKQAGIELAKRIIKLKKIPIIFLTGHPDMFEEAKKVGPQAFLVKGDSSEQAVINAINLAFQNFFESSDFRPKFNLIPKGKVCLTISPPNRNSDENGSAFRKIIIPIEDILYFNSQQGITRLFVKGYEKHLFPTVSASELMKQLSELISEKNMDNPFVKLFNGYYANIDNIVSYDTEYAYFDIASKISCPLNRAAYQNLHGIFPPLKN